MFNIGATELVLILLIAFIVVGPKDLPKVARFLGRTIRKIREMLKDIKAETGFDEVEKELKETQRDLQQTIREADVREELKAADRELHEEMRGVKRDLRATEKEVNSVPDRTKSTTAESKPESESA